MDGRCGGRALCILELPEVSLFGMVHYELVFASVNSEGF